MEWRPIETAPKDGTFVLLLDPALPPADDGMVIAAWIDGAWCGGPFGPVSQAPTHWVPLDAFFEDKPAPPWLN